MNPNAGAQLLDRIETYVVDPILAVIFTLGLFLFFWGLVQFISKTSKGEVDTDGKQHMIWGLIGMLVMVSVYGIINIVVNTLDLDDATDIGRIQNVDPGIRFQ